MKLVIERAALLKSLGHVQSVVERRNTIPVLSNVLLTAAGENLSMMATDMELEIVEAVVATIEQEGATTAPAHTLYDIVRKLPEGCQVTLECPEGGNVLTLTSGRSRFELGCLPTTDFPQMAGGEFPYNFAVSANDFRNLIDRTRFAISTEETRYYLNGIYLHAADSDGVKVLRAVATDGHRLARVEMPLPDGAAGMPGIIIPRKTVMEVRKILDEASEQVLISLSETQIRVGVDKVVVTSKLIDGSFPDYQRVIPVGNNKLLEVDARAFASAVDRVATVSTDKTRAVKLNLEGGCLTLTATSPDAGNAREELEVSYDADNMQIGFNSRYLLDITQQIEGEGARFLLADSASPTVVQDVSDQAALYVLMPMRV